MSDLDDDIDGYYVENGGYQHDLQIGDLLTAQLAPAWGLVDDDDDDEDEEMSDSDSEEMGIAFLVGPAPPPPPVVAAPPPLPVPLQQTPQPQSQTQTLTRHVGVECDECGMVPIVGTRYKCVTRRNYDICRQCWQDNHLDVDGNVAIDDGEIFYAFDVRLSNSDSRELERPTARRNIFVYSLRSLAEELSNDPTIEDVTFHPMGHALHMGPPPPVTDIHRGGVLVAGEMARKAIAEHKGIKTFHMNTRNCPQDFDTITQYVVEGLRDNKSVVSVGISIMALSKARRVSTSTQPPPLNNNNPKKFSKSSIQAIKDLLVQNDTIQFLFLKRPYSPFHIRKKLEDDEMLEDQLFDGLIQNKSLQTFRYEYDRGGKSLGLSDENKKKAWRAMETNPNLRRICCTFQNDDDRYLDLLTTDKKHQWMKRWTTGCSSSSVAKNKIDKPPVEEEEDGENDGKEEQPQHDVNKERYNVVAEVLGQSELDVVPILFRLIRNQPECFLSLQEQS